MTHLPFAAVPATVFCSARAQTAWPAHISSLRPNPSDSPIDAALPPDVNIVPPGSDVPYARARWSGLWQGWACAGQACDVKVAVEQVNIDGATVAYAGASASGKNVHRGEGTFVDNELRLILPTGNTLVLRLRADRDMEMSLWRPDTRLLLAGVLTQRPLVRQHSRSVERLGTPWLEEGQRVSLAMVVYRPLQGAGPWPTLVVHHGSTGNGDRKEIFPAVYTVVDIARHFTAQGWQVIFPQRRGRGGSDGLYDEGFLPNRSAYACDPQYSLPGAERALADVRHVMRHVFARPDVDPQKVMISGVSRGGILASAYAGLHPAGIRGVINFVGGWVSDRCQYADHVNQTLFRRAAAYPGPTLWLYGDQDSFYGLPHSRSNFEAFRAAGGHGRFVAYNFEPGLDGHSVAERPDLWRGDVEIYVREATARDWPVQPHR